MAYEPCGRLLLEHTGEAQAHRKAFRVACISTGASPLVHFRCVDVYESKCFWYVQQGSLPARVPGTVLSNLIENGVFPDPNIGTQHQQAPDIYHAGHSFYTYRFCTSIRAALGWHAGAGGRALLTLHGINYSAR